MSIEIGSYLNSFVVLAGTAIANTGTTVLIGEPNIGGDIGVSPGLVIDGFPPGATSGSFHYADGFATTAQIELLTLYNILQDATTTQDLSGQDLGGLILTPGVFNFSGPATLTGTLTLDAVHQQDPVFIFKIGTSFSTAENSEIHLINGATGCKVFWQVTTITTLGVNSLFKGVIASDSSVNMMAGTSILCGAVYSLNGSITLNKNTVVWNTQPNCACSGGDPHCVCLDGSRIDLYDAGFYKLFDTHLPDRCLINAEVRRTPNHIDYYHQAWVKIPKHEYLLEFTDDMIKITDLINKKTEQAKVWEKTYLTSDKNLYTFICEAKYNTIALTNTNCKSVKCSGLFAGDIIPLKNLKDELTTTPKLIIPNFYKENSLYSGSAYPHVVTTEKKSIKTHTNPPFRLLQWNTRYNNGTLNAMTNDIGLLQKLYINIKDLTTNTIFTSIFEWQCYQDHHWALKSYHDGKPINSRYIFEKKINITPESIILIRVQGNASVSISFKQPDKSIRGILLGDEIECRDITDTKFIYVRKQETIKDKYVPSSIYEKIIEPHVIL